MVVIEIEVDLEVEGEVVVVELAGFPISMSLIKIITMKTQVKINSIAVSIFCFILFIKNSCLFFFSLGGEDEEQPLVAPDGTVWTSIDNSNNSSRLPQHNILREVPGPSPYSKRYVLRDSPVSAWRLFIDDHILKFIKKCTEAEARQQLETNDWSMTLPELEAFISIMYSRGASGTNHLSLKSMWEKKWGLDFNKKTMSRDRFLEIMRFLRFDERSTRSARLETDKFALVSAVWNRFIGNCQSCYIPSANVTIDEQLLPSKARCPFTQYIASKPDKFGQKFFLCVDVDSKYLLNGFPYLGKDPNRPTNERLADHVVMKLMEPYLGKGRNVTTDNFFTSMALAEQLKSKHTSIVGTMNRARREIPVDLKTRNDTLYSTTVYKHDDTTLTVYQAKPSKKVMILSTMHPTVTISNTGKKKPKTITYYNQTKFGVDIIDQMARKYSTRASSRRWPVHTFYNILDLAGLNAWIIYKSVTGIKISRRKYLQNLCEELSRPYSTERSVSRPPALFEEGPDSNDELNKKRNLCQVKVNCKKNHNIGKCCSCKKLVCGKCVKSTLYKCASCHAG